MERIILHCDMDRFYCAIEEKHNPALSKIPFVVCGDPAMRHNIVMSANNIAKRYGIRAGLRFTDARRLCPYLHRVTVDDKKNLVEAKAAREVFYKYSDMIIPYGLDESWLIMEDGITWHEAQQVAQLIKLEIMYSMELSASVGVSYNLIYSKLGSDYRKPNGLTIITKDNFKGIVWPMPVKELLFVGAVREKTLISCGIKTIGDVANSDPVHLAKLLKGKIGYDLHQYANGNDKGFHPNAEEPLSFGNTITPPADMRNLEEVSAVLYLLASAVCARLTKRGLKARNIAVGMKDNKFNTITRQCTLKASTDSIVHVFNNAYRLFKTNYPWVNPLRSVGIRIGKLDECRQMALFDDDDCDTMEIDIDNRIKRLTARFGNLKVESAGAFGKWGSDECCGYAN